ncbi:MAG: sulfatase [Bacteroidota bacterium]
MSDDRPNVIVFVADDLGWRDAGPYGHPSVQTPNLDRLAAEGWTAERAFVTTPQCSPSRVAMLSGQEAHTLGAEDLHVPLPEDVRILPGHLAEAGYLTGGVRKMHLGPAGEAQFAWYRPEASADAIAAFLTEAGDRPFFLWVGFSDPHRGYGSAPHVHAPDDVVLPPTVRDTPETRADYVQYYDEIARLDGVVGATLDDLERRGLAETTVVMFLSDNGAPMPRAKGTLYDAGVRTPLLVRGPGVAAGVRHEGLVSVLDLAPTVLEWAGVEAPASMRGRSLAARLADPSLPGDAAVFAGRNWHNTDEHIRSVRTERWKLIWNNYTEHPHGSASDITRSPTWQALRAGRDAGALTPAQALVFRAPRPRVELYDLLADPHELVNLAHDPALGDTVRVLYDRLQAWRAETADPAPTERRRDDTLDRVTGVKFWDVRTPPLLGEEERRSGRMED